MKRIMKKILTIALLLLSLNVFSQEILLEQNVKADTIRPTRGPNLKNFTYGYVGLGFPIYTNEPVNYTKPVLSTAIDIGVRYKRRLTNFLAVGVNLGFVATAYKLKQNGGKTMLDTIINKKEKFQINTLEGSVYARLNVGRRGNYIGNYLDLGVYGGWNLQKKHKTTNINDAGEKVKVSTTKLKYVENFTYGLLARIGTGRYALTAGYRLSDIFKPSYAMPELPRLLVGVEVGLFK
jgi:hypothetical protein